MTVKPESSSVPAPQKPAICTPAVRRWSGWSRAPGEGIGRFQRINPMQNKIAPYTSGASRREIAKLLRDARAPVSVVHYMLCDAALWA